VTDEELQAMGDYCMALLEEGGRIEEVYWLLVEARERGSWRGPSDDREPPPG